MALKELRQASKSWVASILVGVLVVSFAIWGVNDVFKGGPSRGVAKVGKQWITSAAYQQRYREALDEIAHQEGKQPTAEEIAALGLKNEVLSGVVDLTALDLRAQALGLTANDASLKHIIEGMSAFKGIDGRFSADAYQSALAQNGYTPASFESELREDIPRSQLRDAVQSGAYLPRGLIEDLILYRGEMRQISYVLLDKSMAGDIPAPDDTALKAFIDAHADSYTRPELRNFVAALFRAQDFASKQSVSEDDIKAAYQTDIDKYTVPERREVRSIAFADEASARAAYDAIEHGTKTFEAVAKERGYGDADLAFKEQSKAEMSDPKVADAVFNASGPGLLAPVNGSLAWTLAEVKSVTPGRTKPLAEVHDEIKAKLALEKASDHIPDVVNQFLDGRAGGETDEELAKRLGLTLVKFEGVDKDGKDIDGKTVSTLPEAPELVAAAFASEEGTENDPDFLKSGDEYVVRVDSILPPAVKPFDKIKQQASADYIADQQEKRLQAKAEALATKDKAGGLAAVASEVGAAPVPLPTPLRRDDKSDILSPDLVNALFKTKAGELVAGKTAKGDAYVVASVTAIGEPSPKERESGVATLSKALDSSLGEDFVDQYVAAARKGYGVKVDQTALDAVAGAGR